MNVTTDFIVIIFYLLLHSLIDYNFRVIKCQEIDFSIWNKANSTNFRRTPLKHEEFYNQNLDCQKVSASCKISPYLPNGREGHTSIKFKTYSQHEANRMCPPYYCGPYCKTYNVNCYVNDETADDLPALDPETQLEGLLTSNNTNCPPKCCSTNNELCLRTYDVSGREVKIDEEIILYFGGASQIEVETLNKKISDDCNSFESLKSIPLEPKEKLNSLFLISNCGIQILNDIWLYIITEDKWFYLKPHIEELGKQKTQQIPQSRMYHTSVYLEKEDYNLMVNKRIIRKYMYVYGGFSVYCQNACDDFWYFEIAYGPQRYYPYKNTDDWNRGNRWTQIYSSSSNTPGKRLKHSMVIDENMSFIYLFGGIKITQDKQKISYELTNDLWSYDVTNNKWSLRNSLGISNLTRSILYWDGTSGKIPVDDEYMEITDSYIGDPKNYGEVLFPKHRAASGMVYIKRQKELLVIFGGYTNRTSENTEYQEQLNDIWVFSLKDYLWRRCYPNSDHIPSPRYGMGLTAIDSNLFILYGGINSKNTLNDLWMFNIETNMWIEIKKSSLVVNDLWPIKAQYPTLTRYSKGLILYGGSYTYDLNNYFYSLKQSSSYKVDSSDTNYSLDNINFIPNNNINIDIINSNKNSKSKVYNNSLWVIYYEDCGSLKCINGKCSFGRCICTAGYFGVNCDKPYCPNSFCFYDKDILAKQSCYHCSGRGICQNNGICKCDDSWKGIDCSIKDCLNNCSNAGKCILSYPISQCECNPLQKRGGDDCSIIYCLDNCSNKGICNYSTGVCKCNNNYSGENCSIFFITLNTLKNKINILLIIINFLIIVS